MKLSTVLCLGALAIPSFAFAATCPGTSWTKPFPGSNTVSGDTCAIGETNSIATMCGGFVDSPGNDDVYTFTGDGSSVTLNVAPAVTYAVAVQVQSGTCGVGGTCVNGAASDTGVAGATQSVTFTTTNATVYFVIINSSALSGNCGTYNITGNLPVKLEKFSVD